MKKFTCTLIISCFGLCCLAQQALLLKVSKEKPDRLRSIEARKGVQLKSKFYSLEPSYPGFKTPGLELYYDMVFEDENAGELISELRSTGDFENIQQYKEAYPTSDCTNPYLINDAKIVDGSYDNYAIELINARCAWNITTGNPGIVIGIADTDFDTAHEDLVNQIISVSGQVSAGYQHGTWVASVAGAQTNNNKGICGVAYNSKIAAYRIVHSILPSGKVTSGNGLPGGAQYIKNAILNAYNAGCQVINVSWSGTGLELEPRVVQEIVNNGTTLVLSAGNEYIAPPDQGHSHKEIADIPGVIVVSAVDRNNNYVEWTARNRYVDLCAPGVDVTIAEKNNNYRISSGTSYSAPLVTGTVALMLSVNPNLSPAEIEQILKETAAPINNAHLYPNLLGAGCLDTYAAVVKTRDTPCFNTIIHSKGYNSSQGSVLITGCTINITGNTTISSGANIRINSREGVTIGEGFHADLFSNVIITTAQASQLSASNLRSANDATSLEEAVISQQTGELDFTVIPNPTDGNFTVEITGDPQPYTVEIFNASGSMVGQINGNTQSIHINRSDLPTGSYFLKLGITGKQIVKKLIVK